MRKTEPRLNPATCHIDVSLWRQAQAIAASNRSLPQNSSESTRKLGAPKIPRDRARSVAFRSLAFASGDRAELIRLAGRPIVLRTDVTTEASEMSRSCAKFARNIWRTNSGSQGSSENKHARRAANRPLRGNTDGFRNGTL